MQLAFDDRAGIGNKPGLHALIVGVSDYPHLNGGTGPPATDTYGMRQLSTSVTTASAVFNWLVQHQRLLPVPLATSRLLLSPSPAEGAQLTCKYELATLDNFLTAAAEWRRDACSDAGNVTLFYFAGHGVQRSKDNVILLLRDFGDGSGGGILRKAVDTKSLFDGMAPADPASGIARTQLYFVDACRLEPMEFRKWAEMNPTRVFDVAASSVDDRRAPMFYAALPGTRAYAISGGQTFFGSALLKCMEGGAAVPREENGNMKWVVSISSLASALQTYLSLANEELGANQEFTAGGWWKDVDTIIVRVDSAPDVEISIELTPTDVVATTTVGAVDLAGKPINLPAPLVPQPYRTKWPAGYYTFSVQPAPPRPVLACPPVPILPPAYKKRINVA